MRSSILVLVAVACGPTVATDTAPGTTGDATVADETGATATSDAADSTDTGAIDDACVAGDPAACPAECHRGSAWRVIDDACGTVSVEMCVPAGPKPGVPSTTFWAQTAAGPVFAEYGNACSVGARPDAWHECSGAADEPAECACFCYGGYCRGDDDRRALDECALPWPCEPLLVDPQFGAVDHDAEACVLEGLGARTPGVYEIITSGGLSTAATRFYVFTEVFGSSRLLTLGENLNDPHARAELDRAKLYGRRERRALDPLGADVLLQLAAAV